MQNSKDIKKRGRKIYWDGRLAITALAVGGTIGFWNLFSGQMVKEQSLSTQAVEPVPQQVVQVVEVALPPMPTLVPTLASDMGAQIDTRTKPQSIVVPQPSFQPGARIFLGGASPQQRQLPPVVTTTRSSR